MVDETTEKCVKEKRDEHQKDKRKRHGVQNQQRFLALMYLENTGKMAEELRNAVNETAEEYAGKDIRLKKTNAKLSKNTIRSIRKEAKLQKTLERS
ncbi:hypothetical protein AX774_g5498 [Zancudomyces culisetae]|uniref:Uncharacterized protein n=1 Tax=Zancudomyces culisetae TaxID=1213189 RepID=A0A1R1PJJ7_ZANCU|nr:hypothetical protein AX774_g5498 [Zancudomyces culisetae]|eukprot:OMH81052.1 hypothetical protein AX774_g5498 [Zancudomyces culisetae]